jgi:hypothetical protein
VDSSVHEVTYNTGVGLDNISPGRKLFTLRAVGQSGWRGESTRWFQMNFAPDSWFAGADPNDPLGGWSRQAPPYGGTYRDFGASAWDVAFTGVCGSMLSADSAYQLPASRPQRKTFFEAYNQRLWLRQERDTVHMNSWLIFPGGGFDRDSPYTVRSNMVILGDSLRQYPVLTPAAPNGSPIGFRVRVQVKDGSGRVSQPTETQTYPVVDPASSFDLRQINGYWGLTQTAGKAYAVVRAEDGNNMVDERLDHQPGGAVGVADRVDRNMSSPEDRALRSKVLTFYVNHAPLLSRNRSDFYPRAGATLTRHVGTQGAQAFNLPATDDDWFDPGLRGGVGGTPTKYQAILRWKLAIVGKIAGCDTCDTCFFEGLEFTHAAGISFSIPPWIAAGDIIVRVRLCDCSQCDALPGGPHCPFRGLEPGPGEGTCVDTDIPCVLVDSPTEAGVGAGVGAAPGAEHTGRRAPDPGRGP